MKILRWAMILPSQGFRLCACAGEGSSRLGQVCDADLWQDGTLTRWGVRLLFSDVRRLGGHRGEPVVLTKLLEHVS